MEKIKFEIEKHHQNLFKKLAKGITIEPLSVLDAGSGKTSLSLSLLSFPKAKIDAVVYYGDNRKINSIRNYILSDRYTVYEMDLTKDSLNKKYDVVVCHLILGEALSMGNPISILLSKLLMIETKYVMIMDILENKNIDYNEVEFLIKKFGYRILTKYIQTKDTLTKYDPIAAKNYIGYLLIKEKS